MISSWRNLCLDNITFSSADNFTHSFPAHFHEEYTIGVSVNGIQQFDLQGKSCFAEPHSIFLIKPHIMHSHRPIADLGWSFKSLYLSNDLMEHWLKDAGIEEINNDPLIIKDHNLFKQYIHLHANKSMPDEAFLADFIQQLLSKTTQNANRTESGLPKGIVAVKSYLSEHFNQKLSLKNISNIYQIDKYQLIRQFKQHLGVTPNTYVTILRIEKARKMINHGYPIVEAALEAGFYDQSHFHHNFLYYTGVTPGNFNKLH